MLRGYASEMFGIEWTGAFPGSSWSLPPRRYYSVRQGDEIMEGNRRSACGAYNGGFETCGGRHRGPRCHAAKRLSESNVLS